MLLRADAGATITTNQRLFAGVTQLAECLLPKQDVVGSNPITRSDEPPVGGSHFAGKLEAVPW